VEFVRRNTQVAATLADGSRREQTWTYPEEAVRETIVNALVHRDYLLSGTTVELIEDEALFTVRLWNK
jgi:ATP-dependent DNA helicase RecG